MIRSLVNRIGEMRHLNQALRYDGTENSLFIFTGIGGMGKTALRIAFEKQILKPNKVPYAVLDYDGDPNLRSIEASLRTIRRQLGRHKIKSPVFDYLYARYFELSSGVKLSANNFPVELEGVVSILEGIPFVGNVTQILHGLSQLGLVAKERLQHKEWLYRIRELEPCEILNLLPEVMAGDLEEAMSSQAVQVLKSSQSRIVLLLDAYERLSESQVDDTLHRKFLLLTPHLLRIIFTRDPLHWESKFSKQWHGKITHFPTLEVLSREDSTIFLRKEEIDNVELQDYFHQLTRGYPFHLKLCADICKEIEETTGRKPGTHDFEGTTQATDLTEELVHRLLRQLKDNERDLMGLVAYPRWVSADVLEILSSIPESVPRIFRKFIGLSMFSPHPEIPEAYTIRKEVRDCLIAQQRQEHLWKQRHRKLSVFHVEQWKKTKLFHHLQEFLYHCFFEDPEQAIRIFEEHFWKLLESYHFERAQVLLEAVSVETLNAEVKRKIDYSRARLLTLSSRSQQSLLMAKNLYDTLIASETDDAILEKYFFHFGDNLYTQAEYGKAQEYHQKALDIRLKIFGRTSPEVALSFHNIGKICDEEGVYNKALEYFQKALSILAQIYKKNHPDFLDLYNSLGITNGKQGEFGKALEYFQKGLDIGLEIYEEQHPKVASFYNNIGEVYYNQGEFEKALVYRQKAFDTRLKVFGEEHPEVANSYNNIGIIYWRKSEYDKALECFQKAHAIRLKVYGEEHPAVASSYTNIGNVYHDQGDYGKALEYYKRSLNISLKVYGEEHPKVARTYSNIGVIYDEQGEHAKALEHYQKTLTICQNVYGEEHPAVAISYNNIGEAHYEQGKYEESLKYHQRALNIRLKIFGEEHPTVVNSYNCVGNVYKEQGEYDKALEYYHKALGIALKVYNENHPAVADLYNSIGITTCKKGEYSKALEYFEKNLTIYLKIYGEEHPNVASYYNNIGEVYYNQGEYEKAQECHQKALAIRLKVFGEEHPRVASSFNNIGIIYWRKSEYDKALECFQKAHAIRLKVYGEEHPAVASSYTNIGNVYHDQGDYSRALEYYKRSLNISLNAFGKEHPKVARTYSNIGVIYDEQGEHAKALEYYQKSLTICQKVYGEEHPAVATTYNNIGEAYYDQGEYDKALKAHESAFAIRLKVFGEQHCTTACSGKSIANTLWALNKGEKALGKMQRSIEIYRKFHLWKDVVENLDTLVGWLEEMERKKEVEEARAEARKLREKHSIS